MRLFRVAYHCYQGGLGASKAGLGIPSYALCSARLGSIPFLGEEIWLDKDQRKDDMPTSHFSILLVNILVYSLTFLKNRSGVSNSWPRGLVSCRF